MPSVKRQRTASPEERHRQGRLEEALELVAALQQQLREKDVENHVLKLENEALRREAVSRAHIEASNDYIEQQEAKIVGLENENAELKSSLARCQFPQQQHETESLVAENELLKREKSEAEAKVRGLAENNSNLVQELEARKYETVQLKRDAECYSRYFAQIDNEYEGLRAHIRRLEGAQEEVAAEKDVIVIEDDDDEDDEDFQDAEDIQDEFDDDGNLAYDEMDEYFGVIPSNRQ